MAAKKIKFRGRTIECWEKSCRLFNRNDQSDYMSPVLWIGATANEKILGQLCDFADAAHEAGEESIRQKLKALLKIA